MASQAIGLYMGAWVISSNSTILFNKWLIDTAGFKYPILLVSIHLIFASIVTQIMARTTTKLDSRHDLPKTWTFFLTTILPIGIVSSGSLVCSNLVYLHLSVALIQMLKAASPFTVLLVQWMFGLANPTRTQIINILIIVFGVAIASAGTLEFSFIGFFFQLGGLGFEAVRVVLIEVLLSRQGLKMDAMTGLYYSAPVVAVLNLFWVLGVVAECCCCFYSELYEYGLDWQNIKPRYVSIRDL
ncbi:Sugar phosphate transporter domain [Fusarium oxysporum f. sp. vasinfectum]|nr:Sugar phosphate transporter domain [Fusarium oxysporum f. sp. vasinfectum]